MAAASGLPGIARLYRGRFNFGGCTRELERRRVEIIVSLVEAGEEPPVPRKALVTSDPLWTVKDLGLSDRVTALLENSTK